MRGSSGELQGQGYGASSIYGEEGGDAEGLRLMVRSCKGGSQECEKAIKRQKKGPYLASKMLDAELAVVQSHQRRRIWARPPRGGSCELGRAGRGAP